MDLLWFLSTLCRTSLHGQNIQSGDSNRRETCHSAPSHKYQRDSNESGKQYRNLNSTRRNNVSNKLKVFTNFGPEQSAKTFGSSCGKESKNSPQKTDISSSSKQSLIGQRSSKIKSKSEKKKKANGRSKCFTDTTTPNVQNESQNSKRKSKSFDIKQRTFENTRWPSIPKSPLKLSQDVSNNTVTLQNSKSSQPETVSPKKNEVKKTKISSSEGKQLFNISSTNTSPIELDSMIEPMNKKRKLDFAAQTVDNEIKEKEIFIAVTEAVTQRTEHCENRSVDGVTNSFPGIANNSELRDQCEHVKQDVSLCTTRPEDLLFGNDKPYCYKHFAKTGKGNSSTASLEDSIYELETNEPRQLKTDIKTLGVSLIDLTGNDNVDVQIDGENNDETNQTVNANASQIIQSNSTCSTPVKRSARLSERKERQKFIEEVLHIESKKLKMSVETYKKNLTVKNLNSSPKKMIEHSNSSTKNNASKKSTSGSNESKILIASQNKSCRSRLKHTGARIKVTPLNPVKSSKQQTNNAAKNCRVSVGDIVWGKVHGHPWWPGRVLAVSGMSGSRNAHVAWFGSNTSSLMVAHELAAFSANFKKRFRRNKRGAYRIAVHQAKEAAQALEKKK